MSSNTKNYTLMIYRSSLIRIVLWWYMGLPHHINKTNFIAQFSYITYCQSPCITFITNFCYILNTIDTVLCFPWWMLIKIVVYWWGSEFGVLLNKGDAFQIAFICYKSSRSQPILPDFKVEFHTSLKVSLTLKTDSPATLWRIRPWSILNCFKLILMLIDILQ